MRFRFALLVCVFPAVTVAQTPEIDSAVKDKLATLKYVQSLRDPATGAYKVTPDGKPSLRAVNGAVKAIKYLGGLQDIIDQLKMLGDHPLDGDNTLLNIRERLEFLSRR